MKIAIRSLHPLEWFIISIPFILLLPNIDLPNINKIKVFSAVILSLAGALSLMHYRNILIPTVSTGLIALGALLSVWIATILRGFLHGEIEFFGCAYRIFQLILFLLVTKAFIDLEKCDTPGKRRSTVATSALIPTAISLFLFFLGIQNNASEWVIDEKLNSSATMLGFLGVQIDRVRFVLSSGINSFAVYGGMCVVIGIDQALNRKNIPFSILLLIVGTFSLLLIDSRALALISLIAPFLSKWLLSHKPRLAIVFAISALLLPLALIATTLLISSYISPEILSRNGENALTLSARTLIWASAFSKILSSEFNHILGYGLFGQSTSGITETLGSVAFRDVSDLKQVSMHNSYLQYFVDSGLVGLSVYLVANTTALIHLHRSIRKSDSTNKRSAFCGLVFFMLFGATEVCGTLYGDGFPLYLVILAAAFATSICNSREPINKLLTANQFDRIA